MAIPSINQAQLALPVGPQWRIYNLYHRWTGLHEPAYPAGAGLRFTAGAPRAELWPGGPEQVAPTAPHWALQAKNPAGKQLDFVATDLKQGDSI